VTDDEPQPVAGDAPRAFLTEGDEHLFRQITLPLSNGRPTWEVFKGRKDDDWQVSVDRNSLCATPAEALQRYVEHGATSHGVLSTTVGRLWGHNVGSYAMPEADKLAHCHYDLATLLTGKDISHGARTRRSA
jgi:hypothetical protein